jgi:lipid-A-disaccharide synthase
MAAIESSCPSVLLIAGDVSGDVNTAALARALLEHNSNLTLYGLGGRRLREIVSASPGGQFLADTTNCSAIGISSAIKIYFRCRKLAGLLLDFVQNNHVDIAILCDWGGFNGRILPHLQALGIPTLYYFPPRSWDRNGSHGGLGIASQVTRVATPFQWSAERLRRAGARADWVGHPSLEKVPAEQERSGLRSSFGVNADETLVALLPGSRRSEIRVIAPRMAKAAALVREHAPVRFIAAVPKELLAEAQSYLLPEIRTVSDCAMELLHAADAAVVKTGTATLEAALTDTPQLAVYDGSIIGRIEWCLLWAWRRIPFIAMPNIVLQRRVVPELIGLNCRPERISRELIELLSDDHKRIKMRSEYVLIRQALGSDLLVAPTERTAQIVVEMLNESLATSEAEAAPV